MNISPSLVLFLRQNNILAEEQLRLLREDKQNSGVHFSPDFIAAHHIDEERLLAAFCEYARLSRIVLKNARIPPAIIAAVPARVATHYNVVPFEERSGELCLAVAEPPDEMLCDELTLLLKRRIRFFLTTSTELFEAIKHYYGVGAKTMAQMVENDLHRKVAAASPEFETAEAGGEEHSVINFLDQIIQQAVKDRATDIHIEPYEENLRVRYRIDGLLYDVPVPAAVHHFYAAIMIRIKIMSELDIAEKRLPQDGRIQVNIDGGDYDLRISILPTSFGESAVIRILARQQIFIDLEQLGIDAVDLRVILAAIQRPHGIILVTGPTGSGKTTTLYACLQKINSAERKIITIEDPIEYKLHGISQVQVQPKINLTFANGLRSMLRHDPDIMMVGEIRDLETAELAIRTALTGHMVFSTIHTNDAAGAVTRLQDMGIEPFLVASSLTCLVAQRLVRTICPACKTAEHPHHEVLRELNMEHAAASVLFYQGKGCERCKYTGYRGRTGIFEVVALKESLRDMVLNRVPSNQIKEQAVALGMRTLRQCGWEKIVSGQTTPEEVLRVTQEDSD